MRSVVTPVVLVAIVAGGCGADGGGEDAGAAWLCETAPAPLPPPSSNTVSVVFDVALPEATLGDFGAETIVAVSDGLLVLGRRSAHQVSTLGTVTSTSYADDPRTLALGRVAQGTNGFGATMQNATGDTLFCVLDPSGVHDPGRCVSLGPSIAFPAVTFDGTYWRAYRVHGGTRTMDRWIIDDTPAIVDMAVLWDTADVDDYVAAAFASDDRELLIVPGWHTEGIACPTVNEHQISAAGREAQSVFAPGIANAAERTRAAADVDGIVAALYEGTCVIGNDQCRPDLPNESVYVLAVYEPGVAEGIYTVPLPRHSDNPLFLTSNAVVITYMMSGGVGLSRFSLDGELELSALAVPNVPFAEELVSVHAAAAISDDEYALVYTSYGAGTRLVRFTVE